MLHPEGNLDYPKDARPSLQQEAEFWVGEEGRILLGDTFSIRNVCAYLRKCPALGAPDPDGWRGRDHVLPLFLNDDTDAQERIIKHLILPYTIGDFHPSYLHEHAGGCLSGFHKKDQLDGKILPINNSSRWCRGAAHLINTSVKKEAAVYFTEQFPNFIHLVLHRVHPRSRGVTSVPVRSW